MVVPYHHAKLSVRGLAGLQALATADVLPAIHPEHWNDHVRDLVNATVFSFTSAASEQAEQAGDYVSGFVAARPQFSAAINYYLAAKSACYYPFTEERQEQVMRNAQYKCWAASFQRIITHRNPKGSLGFSPGCGVRW
jgi:hypothetical protein